MATGSPSSGSSSATRPWRRSLLNIPRRIDPAFIERALRIGLTALQDATVSVDVDLVRGEFDKLLRSSEQANAKAAEALDQVLRSNFADGDGRLPRTLEKFLGDRGALRTFVGELFDETKRDSAIGRMRTLLGTYFDGDASKLALLLDPTRQHSPDAPVPDRGERRLRAAPRPAHRDRGRGRRARRRARPVRRPRAATSRTPSRRSWPISPVAPATCSTGPAARPASCSGPRRATSS